jgi:hypothetical protein
VDPTTGTIRVRVVFPNAKSALRAGMSCIGIKPGDKIILDGVQAVHDGSVITTANKVAPAAGGKR